MTWSTATGRRTTRAGLAALAAALIVTGCQVESEEGPADDTAAASGTAGATGDPSKTATAPAGTVIEVTVEGGQIDPAGERVEVSVGEPVTFEVTADQAGELHVHSSPEEQSIAYEPGTHTYEISVEQPGIIEVESHEPHQLVVQLEAR